MLSSGQQPYMASGYQCGQAGLEQRPADYDPQASLAYSRTS